MSGFDDLARQLKASVAERAAPSPQPRRRPPWRGLAVALAALVVGGGVATAAQVGPLAPARDHHPASAREVARRAMVETEGDRACRPYSDGAGQTVARVTPDPVVGPVLAAPPTDAAAGAAALRAALALNHGSPIVAGSPRRIRFPGGATVVAWLTVGQGHGALVDAAACGVARMAQLARDLPDPGSRLRQQAAAVLASYRDTMPGLQTLWVGTRWPRDRSVGGSGIPLDGRALPVGVIASGSSGYTGLAVTGAVRVTLDGRRVHRSVAVRGRFFVFRLPRSTGPVTLRERAADGRVLARQTIRE